MNETTCLPKDPRRRPQRIGNVVSYLVTPGLVHLITAILSYYYRVRARDARVRVMRTLTIYTTFLTPNNSINMALINNALTKIELLEPSKKFSYIKIVNKYSI